MAAPTFQNEDEEAQHCLSLLRDGTPQEKIGAREQLAAIFLRRGLFEEATELYEANVRAGVRTPELFEHLSEAYRQIGEAGAAGAALAEAARLRDALRTEASPSPPEPSPSPEAATARPEPPAPESPVSEPPAPATAPARTAPTAPASPAPPSSAPAQDPPTPELLASELPAPEPAPPARPPDHARATGQMIQFPATPATDRLPVQQSGHSSVTTRLAATHRYDPDADALLDDLEPPPRPRRRSGLAVPGPLLIVGLILLLIVLPVAVLALLVVNPLALYLEGRPAGPTLDIRATTPVRIKVAAGSSTSWYLESGRSVSGLWATPGLELTLEREIEGAGAKFPVVPPQSQGWGETITIVERRGQGRASQEAILLATFDAPSSLPPSGTAIAGRIAGQVTAPRLSENNQFNTTTESIDLPVQLVVVSAPELWGDRFILSIQMFFLDERWLLVTITALLLWCVLAGTAAGLYRVRKRIRLPLRMLGRRADTQTAPAGIGPDDDSPT